MKAFYKQTSDNVKDAFSLQFPDDKFAGLLVANVEDIVIVPNTQAPTISQSYNKKQYVAIFSVTPGKMVWVSLNTTATVPGAVGATDVVMIEPGMCCSVFGNEEIHFITSDAGAYICVKFYQIP